MDEKEEIRLEEKDYIGEIVTLINAETDFSGLQKQLEEYHPFDISQALLEIDSERRRNVFLHFTYPFGAAIVEHFDSEDAIVLLKQLPLETAVRIVDNMETDDAVDLLQNLEPKDEDIDIISLLSPKKRAELNKLLVYEEDEIGSAMSGSFIRLFANMTVKEAMRKVVSIAGDTDYISILYVLENNFLVGYIRLKSLIIARAEERISDIMETRFITARPTDDKEEVSNLMQTYGESSMPITDIDMHLVGIVTHDDLMDIVSEAKSDDYAKLAGLTDGDIDLGRDSFSRAVKQRLPWLSIVLFLSLLTSLIFSFFEEALNTSIVLAARLAVYLPLILDMSGNTGTQSLAVMIRYLNSPERDTSKKVMGKYLLREIGTGIIEGLVIGVLVFGLVIVTNLVSRGKAFDAVSLSTAVVTAFSVFVALLASTLLGALIPLGMDKVKIDPAVASGPFITTVSDIITLSIYYSISLAILLPIYQAL
ncbi:MAG TPA: magnesium transporter [Bacillota bacterium]|nr:magnesium transporter [Bacillota bacterium]HPF42185.1 magnesium transporter [Bacillota bacterium]HPJ85690.1 magnesium transporter [Bacillota bacterium]HPQ61673.1 magnesium transporter [Bacillota bacterium]